MVGRPSSRFGVKGVVCVDGSVVDVQEVVRELTAVLFIESIAVATPLRKPPDALFTELKLAPTPLRKPPGALATE
jgi:hypothetical protein